MAGRLLVVEANEVPLRVIELAASQGRAPALAQLMASGSVVETVVDETLPREMYPSQTWASFGTGRPWSEHGIWWYHDPKPADMPFYWQTAAAEGRSVGLVNVLHSSPLDDRFEHGFDFVVPDCFATDSNTRPAALTEFQALNLRLTQQSSRKASLALGKSELKALGSLRHLGLRAETISQIGRLVMGVATGSIPAERLRSGQFLLMRDLFLRLVRTHDPDLGVFFTNHVAAMMHRYWFAAFPDDYTEAWYDDAWVDRYKNEIPMAVEMLDGLVEQLLKMSQKTGHHIAIVSSMGQQASGRETDGRTQDAVVANPEAFLRVLGIDDADIGNAMNPQISMTFTSAARAKDVVAMLEALDHDLEDLEVDRVDAVVTITYEFGPEPNGLTIGGLRHDLADIGVVVHDVDDHSSGRHSPNGILLSNAPGLRHLDGASISATDGAAHLLKTMDVRSRSTADVR